MKSIMLIDCGSTKADWAFISNEDVSYYTSGGWNPTISIVADQFDSLHPDIILALKKADRIYFYGAGVRDISTSDIVRKQLLQKGAKKTALIYADSDMKGAALSASKGNDGIICILGTGSNTCIFKDDKIHQPTPSLGYILGDEGAGVDIGKRVLRSYFYNKMPYDVQMEFHEAFTPNLKSTLKQIYNLPRPNGYIASFAEFLTITQNEQWKKSLLSRAFEEFIQCRILTIEDYNQFDIHFVGSICYFYRSYLEEALSKFDLTIKSITRKPIEGLVDYYNRKD